MITIGQYLLHRLKEIGVDDIFGVPGDFVLGFFEEILKSPLHYIGTCNELNAAYAADGYARIRGIGAYATTYCVGELSAINGLAGAFAENIPVVAITGVPASKNYIHEPLLHHTLGDYKIPYDMHEKVTVASALLLDPAVACEEIDRVLYACLEHKKPVYLAISADIVFKPCKKPTPFVFPQRKKSNPKTLEALSSKIAQILNQAKKPIIIADGEILRFEMEKELSLFLDKTGIPFATLMLGKGVLSEHHPQFIGLYQGDRTREYVKNRVEGADCILVLGGLLTDFNTGGFTAKFGEDKTIFVNIYQTRIGDHVYSEINLADLLICLANKVIKKDASTLDIHPATLGCVHRRSKNYAFEKGKKLTHDRFFDRLSSFFEKNGVVIAETGSSMFSAAETCLPDHAKFIGQTFYGSIGYTVGATLGAATADKKRRVYLMIGDGSFQVTCQDISTMMKEELNPIIFLINNDGYTIERVIIDNSYNDIPMWKYHQLPSVMGDGRGFNVKTEDELEEALEIAQKMSKLALIEVHLDKFDCSNSLKRAGESMAKTNQLL